MIERNNVLSMMALRAVCNRPHQLKLELSKGLDPNTMGARHYLITMVESYECFEILLSAGANPNLTNDLSQTAFEAVVHSLCCGVGNRLRDREDPEHAMRIIDLFLRYGATQQSQNLVDTAVENKFAKLAHYLISKDFKPSSESLRVIIQLNFTEMLVPVCEHLSATQIAEVCAQFTNPKQTALIENQIIPLMEQKILDAEISMGQPHSVRKI